MILAKRLPSLGFSFLIWNECSTEHPFRLVLQPLKSFGHTILDWGSWVGCQSAATPQCHQVVTQVNMVQALGAGAGGRSGPDLCDLDRANRPITQRGRNLPKGPLACGPGAASDCWVTLGQCIPLSEPCFLPHIRPEQKPLRQPCLPSSWPVQGYITLIVHIFIRHLLCAMDRANNNNNDYDNNSKSSSVMRAYSRSGLMLSI